MPSAARLSGMNSVDIRAAKAEENAVQSTTRTKISQTWFASQTGPIAQAISARGRSPRSPRAENSDQNPAPKSAPPNTAYSVTPIHRTAATASAVLTPPHPGAARACSVAGRTESPFHRSRRSRQRRAIARRTITVAIPRARYSANTSENVTQTPPASVTASSVRITS